LFAGLFTLWVSNENRHSGAGRNPGNDAESGRPILDPGLRRGDRTAVFRFIHSGSPLPFIYDLADLYKEHLCIDLAFALTLKMAGRYNKSKAADAFRRRVIETGLLSNISSDIEDLLGEKNAGRHR